MAISTTEAEYVALSESSREATYLRNLMVEINLQSDEKHIAKNAVCHSRTKHIATRYHYVRDLIKKKQLTIIYTPTEAMPADVFTMPLPGPAHHRCVRDIGMETC